MSDYGNESKSSQVLTKVTSILELRLHVIFISRAANQRSHFSTVAKDKATFHSLAASGAKFDRSAHNLSLSLVL
jgi:hypothetical protein